MLFDQIRLELEHLIPLFGVERQASAVLACFDTLCGESLNLEVRRRAPEFSRINADGTPLQFSLRLDGKRPPLQFLGEAGRPGCGMAERRRASVAALASLAQACGVVEQAGQLVPLLHQLAPERDKNLLADASGIFWFALGFAPEAAPSLTVYVNARWGPEAARWQRLEAAAAFFDAAGHWRLLAARVPPGLSPLGMAFTLSPGKPASGRIYLQAFGQPLSVYRTLFMAAATLPGAASAFDEFACELLRDDVDCPTRSAVFSVELGAGMLSGAKFELCAHCAFAHDAEAANRISGWLRRLGVDAQIYHSALACLGGGRPLSASALPSLHAFAGVGFRKSGGYASVYLNPGPALALA
ncbi:MAG: squalene-hopene cyclase [Polaromonas sp.]|nr:squalene-hopene cyclase [Polaromonas sp.]